MALPELTANSPTPGAKTALTTLSGNGGSITSAATSFNTAAAAPTILQSVGQFHVVIDSEIIVVTAGASGTAWTVARGQEGSTAASHSDGANIFPFLTQGALYNLTAQAMERLQNGVYSSADLTVSTISISTSTGALTIGAIGSLQLYPALIAASSSGLLVPTGWPSSLTITPSLPSSGDYAVVGVELDTTGVFHLVTGTSTSTQLNTGTLIAANTAAVTVGRMRVADFAYWNNSGTINFGDHTTTATQGTNWIDRRPWARGAFIAQEDTSGNKTTSSTSAVVIDTTHQQFRIECTGVPVRVRVVGCFDVTTASDNSVGIGLNRDGSALASTTVINGVTPPAASVLMPFALDYIDLPAAGSHLYTPTWFTDSGTATLFATTADPLMSSIEEIVRQNSTNGTA